MSDATPSIAATKPASSRPTATMACATIRNSPRVRPERHSPSPTAGRVCSAKWRALLKGITSNPSAHRSDGQCAREIVARFGAHAGEVCCYFPGYSPGEGDVADLVAVLHGAPVPR